MPTVGYSDIEAAVPRVRSALQPTLLREWPGLTELLKFPFYLKHENHQPVGAFKVRGGVNLVSTLSDAERQAGILGVSIVASVLFPEKAAEFSPLEPETGEFRIDPATGMPLTEPPKSK